MVWTRLLKPKFEIFWKGIKSELEKILQADITLDPLLFKLEISPEHINTKDHKYMLHILLMITRKNITTNWMKSNPPTKAPHNEKYDCALSPKAVNIYKKMDSCDSYLG